MSRVVNISTVEYRL